MKHLKKYNENVKGEENTSSDHSLICPHCGFEQDENPENILMDDSSKWGLDESVSRSKIKITDTYVTMEDYDEHIQPTLNVITGDGSKYVVNLKSIDDSGEEWVTLKLKNRYAKK